MLKYNTSIAGYGYIRLIWLFPRCVLLQEAMRGQELKDGKLSMGTKIARNERVIGMNHGCHLMWGQYLKIHCYPFGRVETFSRSGIRSFEL